MSTTGYIAIGAGTVGALAAAAWIIRSHSKKNRRNIRKIEEQQATLTADEQKLKQKLDDKKALLRELRLYLSNQEKDFRHIEEILGKIFRIIDDQERILHEATKIEKKDLAYLKHIDINIAGKGQKHHVSKFVNDIEKHFGEQIDEPATARRVLDNIDNSTPDAILRGVKRLAYYLVCIHYDFKRLSTFFKAEKEVIKSMVELSKQMGKLVKKGGDKARRDYRKALQGFSDGLLKFTSRAVQEEHEYTVLFRNTGYVRDYLRQLDQNEAARITAEGPFFVVEGHDVSVITSKESNAQQVFGKGERIDLGYLPDKFAICDNANDKACFIVMGEGEKAYFVAHKTGAHIMAAKGDEDSISIQHGKRTTFPAKATKLKDDDRIVFPKGYVLRFEY